MNFLPPPPPAERIDRVKHFAKDHPKWKLSALLIERMPHILYAFAACVLASLAFWAKFH
jgi:hypothetical protein